MKTITLIAFITSSCFAQTTFLNPVNVNAGLGVAPTNLFSFGLNVRMPAGTYGQAISVANAYSNIMTLSAQGYLMVPAADLGDHVTSKAIWFGDKSAAVVGWPGILAATNTTGPNAYAPFAASTFYAGALPGLTTNINVLTDSGATNQLQFTGGILTGVLSQ